MQNVNRFTIDFKSRQSKQYFKLRIEKETGIFILQVSFYNAITSTIVLLIYISRDKFFR